MLRRSILTSRLIQPVVTRITRSRLASPSPQIDFTLDQYDPVQVRFLDEPIIVVDFEDQVQGVTTKKDAHLLVNITKQPPLIHRAFSLFLFDSASNNLLLQQCSSKKITYPLLWTNTCCSHPLHNEIEIDGVQGVKHAVARRTQYEIGYHLSPSDLIYLTQIFYQARNISDDNRFGECEIDYIIMVRARDKLDLIGADFQIYQNEVSDMRLASLHECEQLVEQRLTTPWFTRIVKTGLLKKWWQANEKIDKIQDHQNIHQL